jgi:hypothetical protein
MDEEHCLRRHGGQKAQDILAVVGVEPREGRVDHDRPRPFRHLVQGAQQRHRDDLLRARAADRYVAPVAIDDAQAVAVVNAQFLVALLRREDLEYAGRFFSDLIAQALAKGIDAGVKHIEQRRIDGYLAAAPLFARLGIARHQSREILEGGVLFVDFLLEDLQVRINLAPKFQEAVALRLELRDARDIMVSQRLAPLFNVVLDGRELDREAGVLLFEPADARSGAGTGNSGQLAKLVGEAPEFVANFAQAADLRLQCAQPRAERRPLGRVERRVAHAALRVGKRFLQLLDLVVERAPSLDGALLLRDTLRQLLNATANARLEQVSPGGAQELPPLIIVLRNLLLDALQLALQIDRDPVLLVRLDVRQKSAEPSQRLALYERIATGVRAMPGVAHAAISEVTPVSGTITDVYVEVETGPHLVPPQNISYRNVITPDWFATYGTRLVAGRDFDARDRLSSPPVAIVNETFVRRFLQGANPLGRRIRNPSSVPGETRPWIEVVGVVADAAYLSLRAAVPPTMYIPLAQRTPDSRFFQVATLSVRAQGGSPLSLARGVGNAIARVDSDVAITFTALKQQVDTALVQERIVAILSGWFSILALLLSALGIYGVTSYAVNRRRTEIGIRMAIGAAPARIVRLVLARVIVLLGFGVLIGTAASIWASQFIATLLYGLEPRDPSTLIASAAILAAVGAFAGALPAYRASCVDPAEVLRET